VSTPPAPLPIWSSSTRTAAIRARARQRVLPLAEAGPWLSLKWRGHSQRFDLVESICPSRGVLFDVEERLQE